MPSLKVRQNIEYSYYKNTTGTDSADIFDYVSPSADGLFRLLNNLRQPTDWTNINLPQIERILISHGLNRLKTDFTDKEICSICDKSVPPVGNKYGNRSITTDETE